ncbi:hypothetical protein V1289_003663 [Bradyrhizobium sp. AZCC 2289]
MAPTYLNEMAPFRPFAAKAPCNVGDGLNGPPCRMRLRAMPLILLGYPDRSLSGTMTLTASSRHCERSEAIHVAIQRKNGLLRCFAPRNDGAQISDTASQSRGMCPSYAAIIRAPEIRGRTECRARAAPAVSCAKMHKKKRTRAYRFSGGTPAFPAQWLYGLFRAPRRRIRLVTVVSELTACPAPGRVGMPPPT